MSKTIDITLVGNDTNINVSRGSGLSRNVIVSLWKDGFSADSDVTNRSITVSFGTLPNVLYWQNIVGKPDGKMFGGILTPSDNAPEPIHDVYYMAFEEGVYSSFGFSLGSNKMAFVYADDEEWTTYIVDRGGGSGSSIGFVQGTRENQHYFDEMEMNELRKDFSMYYGVQGLFIKTSESDTRMTFTLVASSINVIEGIASFSRRGGVMYVSKILDEEDNGYFHWFNGYDESLYTKDAVDGLIPDISTITNDEIDNLSEF